LFRARGERPRVGIGNQYVGRFRRHDRGVDGGRARGRGPGLERGKSRHVG
jgi:hypothetical protein